MRLLKTAILFLLMVTVSCEKEAKVFVPEFDQKIVANCHFTDDGNWFVAVTKTKYILDNGSTEVVDKATVKIYEEDSLIETLPYIGGGFYGLTNGHKAKAGKSYSLEVNCTGSPKLSAIEGLQEKPKISGLKIDLENKVVDRTFSGYNISAFLEVDQKKKGFYQLAVSRRYITPDPIRIDGIEYDKGDTILDQLVHFHVPDYIDAYICHLSSMYFKDEFITNPKTPLQLVINEKSMENTICFNLDIYKISENYYNYGRMIERFSSSSLLSFKGFTYGFSEPVPIESNIVNGYGVFASYNMVNSVIRIE